MKILTKYLKHWRWFAVSLVIFMLLGGMAQFYIDPQYQITSTILIPEDKKDNVAQQTAFSDLNMFHTNINVDNETQVLLSVDLLKSVFSALALNTKYYIKGSLKEKEVYGTSSPLKVMISKISPSAYAQQFDVHIINNERFIISSPIDNTAHTYFFGQNIRTPQYSIQVFKGPAFDLSNKELAISFVNINAMAKSYSTLRLQVTPVVKDANTLLLTVNDNIPQRGVDILTKLIATYNDISARAKSQLAEITVNFINSRLKFLNDDLSNVEYKVQQYKQNNNVTNNASDAQLNLEKASEYNEQLQAVNVQLNIVNSIENYLNNSSDEYKLVPSTLGLQDATLVALIGKFNDLQQERQRLLRTNQVNNPLVININQQLASLRQNIQENLGNIKRGLNINRDNLASNESEFQSKIKTAPVIETGIQQRDRDQSVKQALFQYLIQKREETSLTLLAVQSAAKVIDKPNYDPMSSKPKPSLIYLSAFIFGCIVPVVFLSARESLNKKIEKIDDVNAFTDLKIVGELGHLRKRDSRLIGNGGRSNITELFRYIRNNLNGGSLTSQNKVFLVTSSVQGEGKTFTSINLGLSLSSINKKTVILEFDLRKPDLLKSLKLTPKRGISDYLTSDIVSVESLLQPSGVSDNLFVISSGTKTQDPGELILSPKIENLFTQLREKFDYIIVDTSPVGLVADAFSLSPFTDSCIYMIRYNFTQKSHLNILKDIYENDKLKNPVLILNDGNEDNLNTYVYGSKIYA